MNILDDAVDQSASEIATSHSPALAQAFEGVATGTATPLLFHVDSWLQEGGRKGPLNQRTQDQYRSVLKELADWCEQAGIPPTIEAITKAVAGQFITKCFVAMGADPGTTNKHISSLSSYWRWLTKRTAIEVNPWSGQSRAKASRTNGERAKRPFTDAEMIKLLNGNPGQELADAIRVAALSGMRLEEMYRLRVTDCSDSLFNIRQSKTDAGIRQVPIHTDLEATIGRRTKDKAASAYLFHEAGELRAGRERSMALSKRFGHYRQGLGVEDREEGRRHSRIDFHSFRRWFITKSRNAGIDRAVVAAVVGHEAGNLTDDVYHGGPDLELRKECVQVVRLPS